LVQQTTFQVWTLLFSAILAAGLYLMFPTGRLRGIVLAALGATGLLTLAYPQALQALSLTLYVPIAIAVSALIAAMREFAHDRDLKKRLLELHSSLKGFAREIAAKAAQMDAHKGSAAKVPEYDRWISAEFASRYEKRLTEMLKEVVGIGWFDATHAERLLQMPFRGDGPDYLFGGTKIGVVAGFMNGIWEHPITPREWLRRVSFWLTLAAFLAAMVAIWLAVSRFGQHH
jgi:hypothetical protein